MKQSKYFEALFNWYRKKDGAVGDRDNVIHLDIPDEKINYAALNIAFGSLYCDDVNVKPEHAVNVSLFNFRLKYDRRMILLKPF